MGKAPDGAETVGSLINSMGPSAPRVLPENSINTDDLIRTAPFRIRSKTYSKLMISNLPIDFQLEGLSSLFEVFGKVKTLEKIDSSSTGEKIEYKGSCYLVYENEDDTRKAEKQIIGMMVGQQPLGVKRITASENEPSTGEEEQKKDDPRTKCLVLHNIIQINEMRDAKDYDEVAEETEDEMQQYGKVRVVVPKPRADGSFPPGVGKVFIKFESVESAEASKKVTQSRLFDGRKVLVDFYDESKFEQEVFE